MMGPLILPMFPKEVKLSTRDQYLVLKKAAQGLHGGSQNVGVYIVKHRLTNETHVEKRITEYQNGTQSIYNEIHTMLQCRNHPNIVSIVESDTADIDTTYGSIWMQHCELGSLDALILRYTLRSTLLQDEGFLWKIFWDISQALCYLWTGQDYKKTRDDAMQGRPVGSRMRGWNAVVHRDMKPANILMTWSNPAANDSGSGYPTALLCDFGCSVRSTDVSLNTTAVGILARANVAFEPPESSYSPRGDVYGLGLIIHCLSLMQQVPDVTTSYRENGSLRCCNDFHGELESLVEDCLMLEPSDRPHQADLPMMVWEGYKEWRSGRSDSGQSLPYWAFR